MEITKQNLAQTKASEAKTDKADKGNKSEGANPLAAIGGISTGDPKIDGIIKMVASLFGLFGSW